MAILSRATVTGAPFPDTSAITSTPSAETPTIDRPSGAILAATMGFERGSTVWTDDSEILDAVVVRYPVHVVQNERHPAPAPILPLVAKLAVARLEAGLVEALLQLRAAVARAAYEDKL